MKRKVRIIIIISTIIFLLNPINMVIGKIISGYEILNLGIGGDITTESSISLNKSANSFYYNPALLQENEYNIRGKIYKNKNNIYIGYNRLIDSINYMSIFSSVRMSYIGEIGIGITGLILDNYNQSQYGGTEYTTENKGISLGSYAIILGTGIGISEKIKIGFSVKVVNNDMDKNNIGIGVTGGIIYKNKVWGLGLALNNIGGAIKDYNEEKYPCSIDIGGHYMFYLFKEKYNKMNKISISDKVSYEIINNSIINTLGVEYAYNEIIYARGLLKYDSEKNYKIGCGIGILYKGSIRADYGFEYNGLGITHRVGVGLIWDKRWVGTKQEETINIPIKYIEGEKYIYFKVKEIYNNGEVEFTAIGEKKLQRVAEEIKKSGEKLTRILVYPGRNSKTDTTNIKDKQALGIYKYLIGKGIAKKNITYKVYNNIGYIDDRKINIERDDSITIIITRLSKEEKEKYDYYYYMGMDYNIRGMKEDALKNWRKALKIDPQNKKLKKEIEKLKKSIKKE